MFWTKLVQMGRNVLKRDARDLQLDCARFLHETLFLHVFTYCSETVMEGEI